jgi:hypothetical protein
VASLIDLTTAVTSSLKSTISKHNSIRERRTEVTALVVVWNILARASTVSWLHAGEPERKRSEEFDRIQLRTRYVEDVSAYCDAHPFILSLAGLVTLSR